MARNRPLMLATSDTSNENMKGGKLELNGTIRSLYVHEKVAVQVSRASTETEDGVEVRESYHHEPKRRTSAEYLVLNIQPRLAFMNSPSLQLPSHQNCQWDLSKAQLLPSLYLRYTPTIPFAFPVPLRPPFQVPTPSLSLSLPSSPSPSNVNLATTITQPLTTLEANKRIPAVADTSSSSQGEFWFWFFGGGGLGIS